MSKKVVQLSCYEPISVDPRYEQGWADVWVRYKAKPGRKVYRWGPTLISKADLESEIEMGHQLVIENPGLGFDADVIRSEKILQRLSAGEDVVIDTNWDHGTPTIYTSRDSINRFEAEKMLRAMMLHLGHKNVKLKWPRPEKQDLIVTPASFVPKRLRDERNQAAHDQSMSPLQTEALSKESQAER